MEYQSLFASGLFGIGSKFRKAETFGYYQVSLENNGSAHQL